MQTPPSLCLSPILALAGGITNAQANRTGLSIWTHPTFPYFNLSHGGLHFLQGTLFGIYFFIQNLVGNQPN